MAGSNQYRDYIKRSFLRFAFSIICPALCAGGTVPVHQCAADQRRRQPEEQCTVWHPSLDSQVSCL
ncbi:MAG: hypothetical protein ACLSAC_04345 [Enterocloster bolteae]